MAAMEGPDADQLKLQRLRQWRVRPQRDLSMSFLENMFKQQIARPHKQLSAVVEQWQQLVPAELVEHTRLEGLRRGVLKVLVDSSSRLYELDRLLREGLSQQLISSCPGSGLRCVHLRADDSWCTKKRDTV